MQLLEHLRNYLVAQGLVRDPRVAAAVPPMWLEPRNGTPAPGEPSGATGSRAIEVGPTVVVGAFKVPGLTPRRHEGFVRVDNVDFRIRSKDAPLTHTFEADLRAALSDKRNWDMAGVLIHESLLVADLQPLAASDQGFTFNLEYSFERWS